MAALSVQVPYPVFYDRDGQPLNDGNIYIGVANLDPVTNPLQVYYDEALTITASQPLKTSNGYVYRNGTPTQLYVNATDFSITVNDSKNLFVYNFPQATGIIAYTGADTVEYDPPFVGALTSGYTVANKLSQSVSVKDFGAIGNGVANDTVAIQTAINTGKSLLFPEGTYLANNLTGSTNFQRFYADGNVRIVKNANGPLLTHTGNDVEFNGIGFRGDASSPTYTGDGVVLTGNNPRLINCGSRWISGRAVKATGSHVQIIGSCDIYQTTDTSATGYDIEIGISGTATLYHQLIGIVSSQLTGGIKLIDTGSHVISGGQFGKLYIAAGTKPGGVNGGQTLGARIASPLQTVLCELSNATFASNLFGSGEFQFSSGTADCVVDASNIFANTATLVNNGNSNNTFIRNGKTSSPRTLEFGPSASPATLTWDYLDPTIQWTFGGSVVIPYEKSYRSYLSDGVTVKSLAYVDGVNNNIFLGADNGANFTTIVGGSGGIYLGDGTVSWVQATSVAFKPQADNAFTLGSASQRWSVVYAATGAINTSDRESKQDIDNLDAAEKRVALRIKGLIKKFKFKDAVALKGDEARTHVGVIAQDVAAAFEAEGLDPADYGMFCVDVLEDGSSRYGVRYEELAMFMLGAL
jgi:hypothetical protein